MRQAAANGFWRQSHAHVPWHVQPSLEAHRELDLAQPVATGGDIGARRAIATTQIGDKQWLMDAEYRCPESIAGTQFRIGRFLDAKPLIAQTDERAPAVWIPTQLQLVAFVDFGCRNLIT